VQNTASKRNEEKYEKIFNKSVHTFDAQRCSRKAINFNLLYVSINFLNNNHNEKIVIKRRVNRDKLRILIVNLS
jgi:hypothetical protein